ncbi:DMT family transporter [Acidovorax cavernicola]|uniref:DMT family transporter n=1 Tax=Acidovorax cavernicola TaxID=1675792 RepID=A0A9X8D4Q5_9BURK|nr:DMT family transporter [Acidovorax cavernicola]RIX79584.1 DMT family transporter [Acidovorax cavernicola]
MNPAAPASGRLVAYGCLALSMSLVGGYVALSKPLVAAFPVLLLAWLRFGIAALAMPHWLKRTRDEPPMSARTRGLVFLESFLGNFLFSICMLFGVSLTSAVSAGVIMASIPAVVAVASWLFLRERITVRIGLAIGCAALGIGLLAFSPTHAPPTTGGAVGAPSMPWLGNLLVFCAVLCEAAYAVIGKSLTGKLGPKRIASLINLWGFVLSMPFGIWFALQFDFTAVRFGTWALLVAYALAASIWTVWLWMTGLRHVPAAQAGVFTVLLPVSAALVGVLVLGENLTSPQLLAFAIALVGVVLATWPGRRT